MSKRRRKEVLSDSELKHILNCSDSDSFEDDIEDDFDCDWQAENLEEGEESEEGDEESEGEDLQQIIDDLRVEEEIIDEEAIMEEEDNSIVQEGNGNWTEYVGRHQIFQFRGKNGLQRRIEANSSPLDIFLLLVDDDVWNHIVYQTNNYAQQCQAAQQLSGRKKFACLNQWKPTDVAEMKKFFGLMLWMGLVPLGTIPDYWTTKKIYKQEIPRSVMSRNRFQLLLSLVHFNDNKNEQEKQQLGRLAKIQPLLNILQEKFKCLYYPGEDFVIDETLVPWRGRLIFRQYIPNKTHRYGIKLFKLCSTTGYTWALKVYSGKSTTGIREVGLATNVCLELAEGLLHEGRTLYVDNFYTSYEMAKQLLVKETHLVGTLRANKKDIPKEVLLKKLKRGEIISREDQSGVVVLKWRDTRDVRLLSTKHSPALVPLATRQNSTINEQEPSTINQEELSTTNPDQEEPIINHDQPSTGDIVPRRKRKSTRAESKPEGILAYNKGKSGIDLSDQMASYATTLRKGVKWYRKLGVELVLGIALVNAWIVYNNITKKKKIQIRNFRELLVIELLQLEDKDRDCRISEEEMDFPRLAKLSLPNVKDGEDIMRCGSLEYYDKSYDRINVKSEKPLQRIDRIFHTVTTTDDPVIRKLSKSVGTVYATDAILATLMCCTRSSYSWDIVIEKIGDKLFFDKRDNTEFDLLTVNETSVEPPQDDSNSLNSPRNLALEATFINHNFSQQVLKTGEPRYKFEEGNPFISDEEEGEVASVAYRYRKWDLDNGIVLVSRCEHDAVWVNVNGDLQFLTIKALNEWDSKLSGGVEWRQKLDTQRGAVLANELRNNACKLAKWTIQALLAGSDQIKFGYVSRSHVRDSSKHVILGTQQYKPNEFATQINLNMDNAWGILRCIIDICMKQKDGKYLIMKDPNKPMIRLYDIPDNTFESDAEDAEEEEGGNINF